MARYLNNNSSSIAIAVDLLKRGELVAFPTETVYGLGASIFQPDAIQKIFQVKKRPQDNPLIAHVSSMEQIEAIAEIASEDFFSLVKSFFPGPLTLVLPKKKCVPAIVSGGGEFVAVRMPRHPIAHALIEAMGEPLVAPSANISGKPSSTTAAHVLEDFNGKISAVIDGGPCEIGLESTVLSLCGDIPTLLRPGAITLEALENVLQKKISLTPSSSQILSPGMKYRHYAPQGVVFLFDSLESLQAHQECSKKRHKIIYPTSSTFYADLRSADRENCDEVLIFCSEKVRSDSALMNRILSAAGKKE